MARGNWILAWVAPVLLSVLLPATASAADPLVELKRSCSLQTSTDERAALRVRYRICEGTVASFDGTPLDATLTLPARPGRRPLPLIVFLHGLIADKGEYLSETRFGTGPDRREFAYKTVRWNNIWFASRGYAVLNYTARGHADSGGEIELASKHFEVRDTQHLTGLLVDDGRRRDRVARIDPREVAVLAGSYGGGQAWLLMTTRGDGVRRYGAWRSPAGRLITLAMVVPQYTWTDLLYVVAPNGHQLSTGVNPATANQPFGIGKISLVDGFIATAGQRLTNEIRGWLARLNAGEPYDNPNDPVVPAAKRALMVDRSAFYQEGFFRRLERGRQPRIPVLAAQGWTDPIFPVIEPVRMYRRLRRIDPRYPMTMYFGDFEHLTAAVKVGDMRRYHVLGTRLLDHYLKGRRRHPRLLVRAALTRCDSPPGRVIRARSWAGLSRAKMEFESREPRQTASPLVDPRGPATDPVAVSQQRGRGCIVTDLPATSGIATYTWRIPRPFTMIGLPRLELRFRTTAPDIELNARLWDVAPDGTQTLVDRGAYRSVGPDPSGETIAYELFGNAWHFARGHEIMLEVVQADAPFLRPDNFPSTATIDRVGLTLPTRR